MLNGGILLAAALATLTPGQTTPPTVVKVYYPVPVQTSATTQVPAPTYAPAPIQAPAPIYAPAPNYAPAPIHTTGQLQGAAPIAGTVYGPGPGANFPVYSPPCNGTCGDGCAGSTWEEKFRKLCAFLSYKPLCRTPYSKNCAPYTPSVHEFFRACCDGSPHAPACCTSCGKSGLSLFGQPTGHGIGVGTGSR